jgi:hypothetical protein
VGKCNFCLQEAGFLRGDHKECQEKHNSGNLKITEILRNSLGNESDFVNIKEEAYKIGRESFINKTKIDTLIDEVSVLKTLLSGSITPITTQEFISFNLQKNEIVVWVFKDINYLEQKTRTHYVGGSQGVSMSVPGLKGVRYRVGNFKGERISTQETVDMGNGTLVVTNKHIYFTGASKTFKVAFNKIVSFTPYTNGVGIQRDALTAKPQSFITGDGWFIYNLFVILADKEKQ